MSDTINLRELDDRAAITALIWDVGLSPSEALDYVAVHHWGHSQQSWADTRGVGRQAVNNHVRAAERALSSSSSPSETS